MHPTHRFEPARLAGTQPTEVYDALAAHQRTEAWQGREMMEALQIWAQQLNVEFKLDIPEISLRIDRLPVTCRGRFLNGHNGFGLKGEIALNSRFFSQDASPAEVLAILLGLMLLAWQQSHGTPAKRNYLNAEVRDKARSLGLIMDRHGVTGFASGSPFLALLHRHGIDTGEEAPAPAEKRPRGQSKLKKWSCGCTNVRVAVADFHALCLECRQVFRLETATDAAPGSPSNN